MTEEELQTVSEMDSLICGLLPVLTGYMEKAGVSVERRDQWRGEVLAVLKKCRTVIFKEEGHK